MTWDPFATVNSSLRDKVIHEYSLYFVWFVTWLSHDFDTAHGSLTTFMIL